MQGMRFMDACQVNKQPMGLPWYDLMTVYCFSGMPLCDVKRERKKRKTAGSLSKQMSIDQRWVGGKKSAIIYSWLFTCDRVIQAAGLITWRDLRSTVTDHAQSLLLHHFTPKLPVQKDENGDLNCDSAIRVVKTSANNFEMISNVTTTLRYTPIILIIEKKKKSSYVILQIQT